MLRDAGVRSKLFAILAIPTLLLVFSTAWLVRGQAQAATQAGQVEALTDVAIQVNQVVHSLQQERSVSLEYLQDPTKGNRNEMEGQRRFTTSQLTVLRDKVASSPLDSMSENIRQAAARSAEGHDELLGARRSIDAGRFFATETDVFYSKIIAADLQLPGVIAASATPELAQRLEAHEALSTTIEYASHERDLVEIAYLDGNLNEAEFAQASALASQQRQALQDFQRAAPPALFARLDNNLAKSDVSKIDAARRHLSDLLKGRDPDYGGSAQWLGAANLRISYMVQAESSLVADIRDVSAARKADEQRKATLFGAVAAFGLGLAILLALALAQRITRPLRRLTEAAGEIGDELPRMVERMQTPGEGPGVVVEPIPVETRDEIGRLAEAFNTVNEVTVQVAKEQAALRASIAEMFVNVARRNQVLLGRQLAQLDQLEAREEDPDVLQNLFRLDHLATRMRRNAESLLVLAGIDSTRRLRRALPMSDVIRTAVGEIEAYDRIDLSISDDPDVSPRHALPVAHMLAELLENATHFSNPGTRVVVAAAMTGHSVDVTITDYGLGMSDAEIAAANENIAHPPVSEIAVSQRLGLFVVGRIAARLGASAVLRRGRTAGTVVTVGLPLSVFEGLDIEEPHEHSVAVPSELAAATMAAASHLFDAPAGPETATPHPFDAPAGPETATPHPDDVAEPGAAPADPGTAPADPRTARADVLSNLDPVALAGDDVLEAGPPIAAVGRRRGLLPRRTRGSQASLGSVTDGGHNADHVEETAADVADTADAEATPAVTPTSEETTSPDVPTSEDVTSEVAASEVAASEVEPSEVEPSEGGQGDAQADDEPAVAADDDVRAAAVAGARRRGSFFQRRRTVVPEPARDDVPADAVVDEVNDPVVDEMTDTVVDAAADAVVADALELPLPSLEPADEHKRADDSAELPVETADDELGVDDVAVEDVDHGVRPADRGSRRRGLFGRRRKTVEQPATEAVQREGAALEEDEVAWPLLPADQAAGPAVADQAEPAVADPAEPERADEPHEPPAAPLPDYIYAAAVDILPGRPMRGRTAPPTVASPAFHLAPSTEPQRNSAPEPHSAPVVPAVPPLPSRQLTTAGAPSAPPMQAASGALPAAGSQMAGTKTAEGDHDSDHSTDRSGSDLEQLARSAELHHDALNELRGLYEPSFRQQVVEQTAEPGLVRRTPRSEQTVTEPTLPTAPARARNAAEVRGMLSGFRAGVERGRTAPVGSGSAEPDQDHDPIAESASAADPDRDN